MLIHPWDAVIDDDEWRLWLDRGHDFGQLAVNGEVGKPPLVLPIHFVREGETLLIHLARPNPVWEAIEADPNVLMAVVDDYAYIPTMWRAKSEGRPQEGVPTSYYSAVQFSCRAELVDDPEAKADLLRRQLAHFQPEGDHAEVAVDQAPYGPMLSGIRGAILHVETVVAKFKYDDHRPTDVREQVSRRLDDRATGRDASAAVQQRRRLERLGTWRERIPPSQGP
ncbi:MAG: FMN-binding negative transcriptional regulator [Actinomycetota bacterium]